MKDSSSKRKAIPKKVREKVYKKYNGHCAYCGCEIEYKELQVDHVVSVYWHGGDSEIENYMPSCRACNFYKSTMPLEKFREHLLTLPHRLESEFIYRIAKKYGIVVEEDKPIKFYFEKVSE